MAELDRLVVRLTVDTAAYDRGMRRAQATAKQTNVKLAGSFRKADQSITTVTKSLSSLRTALIGVAAVAGIRKVFQEFASFETALIGVGKTANLAGAELASLGDDVEQLTLRIPSSATELLALTKAAGQLGVKGRQNLLKFTETIAKLGSATNLSGELAATALARILNVTNESIGSVDVLASVIVQLGNNFAATEKEIAKHTNEVARATAQFDIGSTKAVAFGTVLAAIGVRAELGGSVIGRTFRKINDAVQGAGEELQALERIMGRTADEIDRLFRADPAAGFEVFVKGLAEIPKEGISAALESIGLSGDEVNKVLPVLAKRTDLLRKALSMAAKEAKTNTALNTEFARTLKTLSSRFIITTNAVEKSARALGDKLAPAAKVALDSFAQNLDVVALAAVALGARAIGPLTATIIANSAAFFQNQVAAVTAARAQVTATAATLSGAQAQVVMASRMAVSSASYLTLSGAASRAAVAARAHSVALRASSASAAVAAVSMRGLTAAMGFLGGPIGVAITGLAAAYFLLSRGISAAREQQEKLNNLLEDSEALFAAIGPQATPEEAAAKVRSEKLNELLRRRQLLIDDVARAQERVNKETLIQRHRGVIPGLSELLGEKPTLSFGAAKAIDELNVASDRLIKFNTKLREALAARRDILKEQPKIKPVATPEAETAKEVAEFIQGLGRTVSALEEEQATLRASEGFIAAANVERALQNLLVDKNIKLLGKDRIAIDSVLASLKDSVNSLKAAKEAQEEYDEALETGRQLTLEMRTPLEAYVDQLGEIDKALAKNTISEETAARARGAAMRTFKEAEQGADDAKVAIKNVASAIATDFEDAIVNARDQTLKWQEVLRSLEKDIIRIVARLTITKPLEEFAEGLDFENLFGGGEIDIAKEVARGTIITGGGEAAEAAATAQLAMQETAAATLLAAGQGAGTAISVGATTGATVLDVSAVALDASAIALGAAAVPLEAAALSLTAAATALSAANAGTGPGGTDASSLAGPVASLFAGSGSIDLGAELAAGTIVTGGFHKGGVVGRLGGPRRAVSPAAFIGAQRMHAGGVVGMKPNLRALGFGLNERPIVADKGERVVTQGQNAGNRYNININLPPGASPRDFRDGTVYMTRRLADEIDRREKFR